MQDQGAGDFYLVVHQKHDQVMRHGDVIGQALGQRDADRHLDIAGEAAENFAHQVAFAAIETSALDAVKRGDGEVDFLAACPMLRIKGKLGQAAHVTHVVRG